MNQSELIADVAARTKLTQAVVKQVVDATVAIVTETLVTGTEVGLPALGKFKVKATAPREGRNPATGSVVQIPAGRKVAFSISKGLKTRLVA